MIPTIALKSEQTRMTPIERPPGSRPARTWTEWNMASPRRERMRTSAKGVALLVGPCLWALAALATSAHPPRSQQPLAWRWLRTVSAHPVRSSLAFACLALALAGSGSLLPERPERQPAPATA